MAKNDNERFKAKIACKATNIASPTATTIDGKLKPTSGDRSNFYHDDSQSHLPLKKNDSTTAKKEAEGAKSDVDDMRSFPIEELPNSNPEAIRATGLNIYEIKQSSDLQQDDQMKNAARASAVTETHGFSNDIHIAGISRAPAVVLQQSEAPYGSSHWENDVAPEAGSEAYTNELVTRMQQDILKTKLQNPKTVDIFAAAFKSNTRIPQTWGPAEQKRYTVPYETKKDSIRKAMHEINNLEAMAVTVQDYPTTTESIAPFLKLYERTKADATFWADQAATLNEKTRKSRRKFPRSD
ncbi:hypothetical protein V2W45_1455374 [Cenococcum geophilum]